MTLLGGQSFALAALGLAFCSEQQKAREPKTGQRSSGSDVSNSEEKYVLCSDIDLTDPRGKKRSDLDNREAQKKQAGKKKKDKMTGREDAQSINQITRR